MAEGRVFPARYSDEVVDLLLHSDERELRNHAAFGLVPSLVAEAEEEGRNPLRFFGEDGFDGFGSVRSTSRATRVRRHYCCFG